VSVSSNRVNVVTPGASTSWRRRSPRRSWRQSMSDGPPWSRSCRAGGTPRRFAFTMTALIAASSCC